MARVTKCTPEAISKAAELKGRGMFDKDIAAALNVSPSTLSCWLNHPKRNTEIEFSKALKEADAEFRQSLEARIIEASRTDWKAAAWLLERKFPMHYSLSPARFAAEAEPIDYEPDPLTKSLMELGAAL